MRTEFDRDRAVLFDIEAVSPADLRSCGARAYIDHPLTRPALVGLWCDGEYRLVVLPDACHGEFPAAVVCPGLAYGVTGVRVVTGPLDEVCRDLLTDPSRTWVAHNATGFDAPFFRRFWGSPAGGFADSLPLARRAGLPGALDEIGKRLLGVGKDPASKIAASVFRCFDRPIPPGKLALVGRYCVGDVAILKRLWDATRDVEYESSLLQVDGEVNGRGVAFERELAARIVATAEIAAQHDTDEIGRLTNGVVTPTMLRSPLRLKEWFHAHGARVENVRSETLEAFLDDPAGGVKPVALEVMKLKSGATRITTGKLKRALSACSPDGRLRDLLVYHGAHTGRWTSRTVQIHNLPRGVKGVDVDALARDLTYESALAEARRLEVPVDAVLSTLIRPCLVAGVERTLCVADYSAIECRGVAWFAGAEGLLDVFRRHRCPYRAMASRIYDRPYADVTDAQRQVGKVVVLGSGYGLSSAKFAGYAANFGIDLDAAGVSADECIDSFRQGYPEIPLLWREYDRAAKLALTEGVTAHAGRCYFARHGDHLIIELPSGRQLTYRNARCEDRLPLWARWVKDARPVPSIVYSGHRGEAILYGGKITENVVQAHCRDMLAHALVGLPEAAGGCVFHVHDEIVTEAPLESGERSTRLLAQHMSTPPAWAPGFPVEVKSTFGRRYSKGSGDEIVARNGEIA